MNRPSPSSAAIIAGILHQKGIKATAHHETIKKAWRDYHADSRDQPPALDIPRVRVELARLAEGERKVTEPPADFSDLAPEATNDPWLATWERAKIEDSKVRADAELEANKTKEQKKQEKLDALRELNEEKRLAKANARAVAAIEKTETNTTNGDSTMATSTKSSKKSSKANKTPRAPKVVLSQKDILAALQKKYPHVKEVLTWTDTGKAEQLLIRCDSQCKECEKTRAIWAQDAFQVKHCEPCKKVAKKVTRIKAKK